MNLVDCMYPGDADEGAEPWELEPAAALGELRDALAGWIGDALEAADGYVHDPDRDTATQIMNSLYASAAHLANPRESNSQDWFNRITGAGRHLGYAADQLDGAIRLVRKNTNRPDREDDTELTGMVPGLVRTFYGAAVAYTRQACDMAYGGPRVQAVATITRCCGGSFSRPCSHGREEDHVIPSDGRCEAAQFLADAGACTGTVDEVIIRDATLGLRHGDRTDQRGVRACTGHGVDYLRTLDKSTRVVYPGPGDPGGQTAGPVAVYTTAAAQDTAGAGIPLRVDGPRIVHAAARDTEGSPA